MKIGKVDFNAPEIVKMTKAELVKNHINDFFKKETDLEKRKKLIEKLHDDCVAEVNATKAGGVEAPKEQAAEPVKEDAGKSAPKAKPGETPEK